MLGRFVKRQIRKGARKVLPAPLNKFPGPLPRPHNMIKEIVDEVHRMGHPKDKRPGNKEGF